MKTTKSKLKQIIKEELESMLEQSARLRGYENPARDPEFLQPTLTGQIGSKPVQQNVPDLDQATQGKVAAGKEAAEARKAREKLRKTSLASKLEAFEKMEKDLVQYLKYSKGLVDAALDNYPEKSKAIANGDDDIEFLLGKVRRFKKHTIKLMRRQGMKDLAKPLKRAGAGLDPVMQVMQRVREHLRENKKPMRRVQRVSKPGEEKLPNQSITFKDLTTFKKKYLERKWKKAGLDKQSTLKIKAKDKKTAMATVSEELGRIIHSAGFRPKPKSK